MSPYRRLISLSLAFLVIGTLARNLLAQLPELQDHQQVRQFLQNGWKLDFKATDELLPKQGLLDGDSLRMGVPIVPYSLQFRDNKLILPDVAVETEFQVKSYDPHSGELLLAISTEQGVTILPLKIVAQDSLILKQAATIAGPLSFGFKRVRAADDADTGLSKEDSDFAAYAGSWELNVQATRDLWKEITPPLYQKISSGQDGRLLKSCAKIVIEDSLIHFVPDGSAERLLVTLANDTSLFLKSEFDQNAVAIGKFGDKAILLVDSHRQLFAIYGSLTPNASSAMVDPRLLGMAKQVGGSYSLDTRSPDATVVPPMDASGETEIFDLRVDRHWASSAVRTVDLTTTEIGLFFNWGFRDGLANTAYTIKIKELGTVVDDTGARLDPEPFRARMEALKSIVELSEFSNQRGGRAGPIFRMTIDAPNLGARSIEQLAGEAVVTRVNTKWVRIANAREKLNQPLQIPLLPNDAKLQLRKDLTGSDELHFQGFFQPSDHALSTVTLLDKFGQRIPLHSATGNDTLGFRELPDRFDVWVQMRDPVEARTFPFQFKNIPLPK